MCQPCAAAAHARASSRPARLSGSSSSLALHAKLPSASGSARAAAHRQRSSCPKLPACQQPTARLLLGPSQPGAPTSRLPSFLHLRARRPACTHGRQPARATRCHPRQLALTSSLLSFLYLEALMSRIALPAAGFMHLV